jgi:hypothetical protein
MNPPVASVRVCVCVAYVLHVRSIHACARVCCVCTYMEQICGTYNMCFLYVAKMCTTKDVAYEPHRGIGPVLCICAFVCVSACAHVFVCLCVFLGTHTYTYTYMQDTQ